MTKDHSDSLRIYTEQTKEMLERVRKEVSEDAVFSRMEEMYNAEELLDFNEFNIKEKLERSAFHLKDFKLKYLQEEANVEKVRIHLDKVIGERYKSLREGSVSLTKQEIEKYYLTTDPEIIKIKGLLAKQELRAKYFLAIYDALDKQGWAMKNYIDLNKNGF